MKHSSLSRGGLWFTGSLLVGLALAGCNDNDDDNGPVLPSGESLVRELIVNGTTESAEPIDVNGLNLQFSEDPNAFNDLLD